MAERTVCAICEKPYVTGDDVVEYTDGTSAHGECHDDVVEAHANLADYDRNGGTSLEDLRKELEQ